MPSLSSCCSPTEHFRWSRYKWRHSAEGWKATEDHLVGYKSEWLEIVDPSVIEASGKSRHPIIVFTGRPTDLVCGTAFRVSRNEILRADTYEVADYRRECLTLASGRNAWVYVGARAEG